MPEPPARGESSTEFFHTVVKLVQSNSLWPEQCERLSCEPTCPSWSPGAILSNGPFIFRPMLSYGTGGELRIDCYLYGAFDHSGRRELLIGTIKTARSDCDTCVMLGSLTGALLHYGEAYREANLSRYKLIKHEKPPEVWIKDVKGE